MNHTEPKGQILPGTRFGDMLTELAKQSETIVEIGSWHGLGSTKCLANGLVRSTQRMWTFETNIDVCKEASSYYNDDRIAFVNGVLLLYPVLKNVNLLLLDGDDFDTDKEFELYKDRVDVIALDDTLERKNRLQRAIILNNPATWDVLADVTSERLGWMIARRLGQ
jgi:predicted O-methyltransferase YrrM